MATDPMVTMIAAIKTAINAASRAGELKDGNTPVRNVWDTLDDARLNPGALPLIQFDELENGPATYEGDGLTRAGFRMRFIVWVNSGPDRRAAVERCRLLRSALIDSLHNRRPFSTAGAARQSLSITREAEQFETRFAVGLGLIVAGDIMEVAG